MNKILSNIEVSGNKIEYFLIFKRTRYLKMYVNRKNEIVVISPKTILKRSLNNFIIKNIQKMHKAKVEKKESSYALKINDNKIIILGTTYARSTITQKKKKYEFNNNNFVIYSNTDKKTKQVLYSIYNDFCFSWVKEELEKWKAKLGIKDHISLKFKWSISRWGSYSIHKKEIAISYQLLTHEKELVIYTLVHELSHYYFHNHSKRFWNLVAQYIPDYKLLRKKLNSV